MRVKKGISENLRDRERENRKMSEKRPEKTDLQIVKASETEEIFQDQEFISGKSHEYDQEEKKVLRKIDMFLMPMLVISYGLQFLDKATLGYGAIYGIIDDTHLVGQQYSWTSSIFYFGYLFWEYPGTFMMKYWTNSSHYLGIIMSLWSIICILTSVSSSFAGLMVVRFVLGMLESIFAPAFLIIVSSWYRRTEQPIRQVIWFMGTPIFSMLGGIIAYGIGHANVSVAKWKLLFIIFGSITFLWGFVIFFFLPSRPEDAWFLTEEEKKIANERIMGDSVQKKSEWKNYQVKEAFIDPKTWFCFFLTLVNCIGGDLADFKTMIYQSLSLNKTPLHSVVMTFPGSAVQIVSLVTCGLIATKVKSSTLIVMSIFTIPSILGTALIHFLPESKSWGRCAGLWISYTNTCSLALNFSVIASNVRGYTKKSVVSALNFIAYCVGSIAAPQFFYSRERAAGFPTGIKTMFVCYIIVFFLPLLHLAFLIRCNRKRIKEKHSMDDDKVDDYLNEDKTDWEIKGFQYSY